MMYVWFSCDVIPIDFHSKQSVTCTRDIGAVW